MNVAVTASSGQLGGAIVKELIGAIGKENIVGTARNPSNAKDLGVTVKSGDYNRKSDFDEAFKGIDVVLIVSGMDVPDKRVEQHRNIIHAAKDAGVRKIVYTSIIGKEGTSTFDAIIRSNRQTEQDIRKSGLEWCIGRNGLYIEPDVEYMETYKKEGKIVNCAAGGLCSYVARSELAIAFTQMILNDDRNGRVFNLAGNPITQEELTCYLNSAYGTDLVYESITPEAYLLKQQQVNGEFLGMIIAGIYTKIRNGEFNIQSDFEAAAGRSHISWEEYFKSLKHS
jgi:NAD(P)H dehydrogenase (quinone)